MLALARAVYGTQINKAHAAKSPSAYIGNLPYLSAYLLLVSAPFMLTVTSSAVMMTAIGRDNQSSRDVKLLMK